MVVTVWPTIDIQLVSDVDCSDVFFISQINGAQLISTMPRIESGVKEKEVKFDNDFMIQTCILSYDSM